MDNNPSGKKKTLTGLFKKCDPLEGKFLSKILTNGLQSVLEGLLLKAIAKARGKLDTIQMPPLDLNISDPAWPEKTCWTQQNETFDSVSYMLADVMHSPREIANYFERDSNRRIQV